MPNVTFKFIITETPLPADQDGRQQIIASISDDNAKRITDLTGLAGEVEALKAHCHRMLNLARNRFLGYCDHNRSTQAIMEECQRMGLGDRMEARPALTGRPQDVLISAISLLERNGSVAFEIGKQLRAAVNEMEQALAELGALVQTTSLHEQAARAKMQTAAAKVRMHDDARAMLDTLGVPKLSETGGEFTLQHRIGLLNDESEREKGAAYRDATAAEERAEKAEAAARWAVTERDAARAELATAQRHGDIKVKLVQSVVLMPVLAEISRALTKFPTWPTDPLHAMAVLGEEYGELNKAILQEVYEPHKQDRTAVRTEAVQCAAMALRFLTSIDSYRFDRCEQHRQEVAG